MLYLKKIVAYINALCLIYIILHNLHRNMKNSNFDLYLSVYYWWR